MLGQCTLIPGPSPMGRRETSRPVDFHPALLRYNAGLPLPLGGEAETRKGPVDLFSAERAQTILLRPGGNSWGEGNYY